MNHATGSPHEIYGEGEPHLAPGLTSMPQAHEAEALLQAWYIERGRCIEGLLILGRVRRLLRRIANDGLLAKRHRREVTGLLRAIEKFAPDELSTDI